ncbi:MAG: DUF1564 family protein [Leptonema sp. (in: bacteria)]
MLDTTTVAFEASYRYCVSIQPHLYQFFKENASRNPNPFLEFLIQKYEKQILYSKAQHQLKRASCQYQPKTKDYKRIVIRGVSPEIWRRLKNLKSLTGYSISYLFRVMLEWELENRGKPIQPLLPQIHLELGSGGEGEASPPFPLNNYVYVQYGERRNQRLFTIFLDFF